MAKFKVGDKVKYIGKRYGGPADGTVGEIRKLPDALGRYEVAYAPDSNVPYNRGFMMIEDELVAANTRTLPVSKQAWTECEKKAVEWLKKWLPSHGGKFPVSGGENAALADEIRRSIPDMDDTEFRNAKAYFTRGPGKNYLSANSVVANAIAWKRGVATNANIEWSGTKPVRPGDKVWVEPSYSMNINNGVGILKRFVGSGKTAEIEFPGHGTVEVPEHYYKALNAKACNATGDEVVKEMNGFKLIHNKLNDGWWIQLPGGQGYGLGPKQNQAAVIEFDRLVKTAKNSVSCNAKFKVGDHVKIDLDGRTATITKVSKVVGGEQTYHIKYDGSINEDVVMGFELVKNSTACNAKFKAGDKVKLDFASALDEGIGLKKGSTGIVEASFLDDPRNVRHGWIRVKWDNGKVNSIPEDNVLKNSTACNSPTPYPVKKLVKQAWDMQIDTPPAEFKKKWPNTWNYMKKHPEYVARWGKDEIEEV